MIERKAYPILEYDTERDAVINPSHYSAEPLEADRLIITFFPEVLQKLLQEEVIRTARVIPGENPIVLYAFTDDPDVLITPGVIGCPACAGDLDQLYGMGIRKVMFCGGGGVLDTSIGVGRLLLVDGAIRDDGFSYHYVEPSRVIYADEAVNTVIAGYLDAHGIPYLRGLTWTTDALFRETREKVALRRSEGAKIVEMEQSGCLAVAQYRGLRYGALIYAGDDVSQDIWDKRDWRSRNGLRYDLVMLCRELVREI